MKSGLKTASLCFGLLGLTFAIVAHWASDGSIGSMFGPIASLLCFITALVLVLVPKPAQATADRRPALRVLPRDVLNDASLAMPIAARVTEAIELSKAESCCFGVICFARAVPGRSTQEHEKALHIATEASLAAIARSLRNTDRATSSERGEILIFLPLLQERRDLESVSARLQRVVQAASAGERGGSGPSPVIIDVGTAMYPIDGYDCDDLVASARAASRLSYTKRIGKSVGRAVRASVRGQRLADDFAALPASHKPRVRRAAGSSPVSEAPSRP